MKEIKFSQNWNNKLDSKKFFTTIRLRAAKYKVGSSYKISLSGKVLGMAKVKKLLPVHLDKLPEVLCFLDTGYNLVETQKIIKQIYSGVNWNTEQLVILLMEWTKKE